MLEIVPFAIEKYMLLKFNFGDICKHRTKKKERMLEKDIFFHFI